MQREKESERRKREKRAICVHIVTTFVFYIF